MLKKKRHFTRRSRDTNPVTTINLCEIMMDHPFRIKPMAVFHARMPHLIFWQRWLLKLLLLIFGHFIKVENAHQLNGYIDPVIFAFNHNSSYETMLVVLYLLFQRQGKKVSFLVDWMYGQIPLLGWLIQLVDPIYVYNKPAKIPFLNHKRNQQKSRDVYAKCVEWLQQQKSVGIFPEGTRNKNPEQLKRGRKGIGHILLQTGVPVIPIGIDFPARLKNNKIPKFGRLILRVGQPKDFQQEIVKFQKLAASSRFSWFLVRVNNQPAGVLRLFYDPPLELPPKCKVTLNQDIDLKKLAAQGRFVDIGRFMIKPEYRRNILVTLRLMRMAIKEVVERDYTHFITDVFENEPHSPLKFHTNILGFEVIGKHLHGELSCSCTRIILALDILKGYQRLKARRNRVFRMLTQDIQGLL